ncbi:hypothetical protein SYNPS1DRAFT_23755 [Syncephalis pseudoplumigaleata]|uniref:PLC-like phosphodiesterase n=1 Tax=Syncephalis pseudoplumigaleata TaxID=1712513 RepID=A0A4P9YVT7_9FUNG|nr:hypothetical protein SYNPS1DRAFT_23755 [Syncephalis pseudoplumigaleata]|eukprot:RKP24156.1 hypothetical protein SYNPS1DRAFT_23755 [Syncephalis pseudoplumigaleata]
MLDAHQLDPKQPTDTVRLCHESCALLDAGTMTDGLRTITEFIEDNPREFVVLLIENSDNFNGAVMAKNFDASGITRYAYHKQPADAWPTLAALLDDNKRVMVLFDRLDGRTAPW